MKLFILLSVLSVANFAESASWDIGSFFSLNSYKSQNNQSVNQTSSLSNKHVENQNNTSFSFEEDIERGTNVSNSSPSQSNELSNNATDTETLKIEKSTGKELNNTHLETYSSQIQPSTENNQSLTPVSSDSEHFTPGSNSSNVLISSFLNVSTSTEEREKVVLGTKPTTFTVVTKTIYQKTIEWVGDTYTLSILIPVAAGVLFAVTIILIIAICRCIRRKCRRRRFRKRVLPDSIKCLRPSDQARLLGDCDSSDEF